MYSRTLTQLEIRKTLTSVWVRSGRSEVQTNSKAGDGVPARALISVDAATRIHAAFGPRPPGSWDVRERGAKKCTSTVIPALNLVGKLQPRNCKHLHWLTENQMRKSWLSTYSASCAACWGGVRLYCVISLILTLTVSQPHIFLWSHMISQIRHLMGML